MKISNAEMVATGTSAAGKPGPAPGTPESAGLFRRMLDEVNGWQSQADHKVQQSLTGEADLHDALISLEQAAIGLKVLVQVRNKVIQAYEELNRMPL